MIMAMIQPRLLLSAHDAARRFPHYLKHNDISMDYMEP